MARKIILILILLFAELAKAEEKPPVAIDEYAVALAGTTTRINVMKNDYCMQGHTMVILFAGARLGEVKVVDSCLVYTCYPRLFGQDTLSYILKDLDNGLYSQAGHTYVDIVNGSSSFIDANNISAMINGWGNHFYNNAMSVGAQFIAPQNSGCSPVYSMSLWMSARDVDSILHVSAERYALSKESFWSGPVADSYDQDYLERWNRVWKIDRQSIEYHKRNWWKPEYEIPQEILTWPAHGDSENGEAANIAPFTDLDHDGIYDPGKGDAPLIRGDQAIFFVFNDFRGAYERQDGNPLGIDIYGMAYVFRCQDDPVLDNTVFFHYEICNRSDLTYQDSYLGTFCDFDLGNFLDDYLATDVARGTLYAYNGDNFDEDKNLPGYHDNPPSIALTILSGPFMDENGADDPRDDGYGNILPGPGINGSFFGDGITDNERMGLQRGLCLITAGHPGMGNPLNDMQFDALLRGYFPDMQAIWYGGNGHPSHGAKGPACRFMFPGYSDPWNWGTEGIPPNGGYNQGSRYWTEEAEGIDPGDRSALASMGPFTFHPGERQELDFSLVYSRAGEGNTWNDCHEAVRNSVDRVREYFSRDSIPCSYGSITGTRETAARDLSFITLYPQPARDRIYLKASEGVSMLRISCYDMTGKLTGNPHVPSSYGEASLGTDLLLPGLYVAVIETTAGTVTKKFLKF